MGWHLTELSVLSIEPGCVKRGITIIIVVNLGRNRLLLRMSQFGRAQGMLVSLQQLSCVGL